MVTQIEVAQHNHPTATQLAGMVDVTFKKERNQDLTHKVPFLYGSGGNSPPFDSCGGDSSHMPPSFDRPRNFPPVHRRKSPSWCPFKRMIFECDIPRSLEKPTKLESYDKSKDHDEHITYLDTILDYHEVRGEVKCKLFVIMLKNEAMTWFKGLGDDSIDSWETLFEESISHFIWWGKIRNNVSEYVVNLLIHQGLRNEWC